MPKVKEVVETTKVPTDVQKVIVIATAKATHLITGKEYEVNPILAQKLIDCGSAKLKKTEIKRVGQTANPFLISEK